MICAGKARSVGERLVATPLPRGAALTTTLVRADGILLIPRGSEGIFAGTEVEIKLLKPEQEIRNTVVAIGSHDLMLDIIANLLREKYPQYTLSSAHVGSLGGLLALRRGETHLWYAPTGSDNRANTMFLTCKSICWP